jgi:ATP-binding cassette subfamily B protein
VLVLWFGGSDVIAGRLTLGQLVAFSRYQMLLGWPITGFGWVMNILQCGLISWRRMFDLLDVPVEAEPARAAAAPPLGRRLEARHLSFRYADEDENALDDVSFTVSAGKVLAIVGATGSGKSTLVNLLGRLHPVAEGMLFLDGVDVATLPIASVRRAVSMAMQEPFIFGDSIGANIAFGVTGDGAPAATRAMTERAAELAHLAGEIAELPGGYDTIVGERGVTLSGGQRQRVAVARALMTNSPILVLDDALSKVDAGTEARILAHLRAVGRSRICVIVAHRISTVRGADQILVLDRGRIVERGSHPELLASGGRYAEMCRRQSIEQELSDL